MFLLLMIPFPILILSVTERVYNVFVGLADLLCIDFLSKTRLLIIGAIIKAKLHIVSRKLDSI